VSRVPRSPVDPDNPQSIAQQQRDVIETIDNRIEFGEPLDPNDPNSAFMAGLAAGAGVTAHNGIRSNILGSWVELEITSRASLDYPFTCRHNLYQEQPDTYTAVPVAGEPNCRWIVMGWQHDGTQQTLWEDLRVNAGAIRPGGNSPTWGTVAANAPFNGNLNRWWFDWNAVHEDEVEFEAELPHNYKEGTNIECHVHWVPEAGAGANACVKWGLEYTWANQGSTFPATTTIYTDATDDSTQTVQAENLVVSRHYVSVFEVDGVGVHGDPAVIDGTEPKTMSSSIVCRLFRNTSHADDDYNDEAGLLHVDFHYQVDGPGSYGQYVKTADIELGWAGPVSVMYNSEDSAAVLANSIDLRFYASPFLDLSQGHPLKISLFFIKATRWL